MWRQRTDGRAAVDVDWPRSAATALLSRGGGRNLSAAAVTPGTHPLNPESFPC